MGSKKSKSLCRFLVQWLKYVRRLQPCEEPSYQLLHDYITHSGRSSSRGSTALWDSRDAWMLARHQSSRKRSVDAGSSGHEPCTKRVRQQAPVPVLMQEDAAVPGVGVRREEVQEEFDLFRQWEVSNGDVEEGPSSSGGEGVEVEASGHQVNHDWPQQQQHKGGKGIKGQSILDLSACQEA